MGAARYPNERPAADPGQPQNTAEGSRVARIIEFARPQRFARVPTHTVGVARERRQCPRAALCLPLRLKRVGEEEQAVPASLVTQNLSSSGICFLSPQRIEPGAAIELEVALVDRPLGRGNVRMVTAAHIVRSEAVDTVGWFSVAATFDDFDLARDDHVPLRFQQS